MKKFELPFRSPNFYIFIFFNCYDCTVAEEVTSVLVPLVGA